MIPTERLHRLPPWLAWPLAGAAGALMPLALAPFNAWPLALVGLAALALLLHRQGGRAALGRAFAFGLGQYAVGISWIYVSIHQFGGAGAPLAALMTGLFVAFVAAVFALPYWAYGRWFAGRKLELLAAFPAFWLLGEWVRTWLLTGFPWLYPGYSQLDTWLAGWAPLAGVLGVGLILAYSAALAAQWLLVRRPGTGLWLASAACLALWGGGAGLRSITWTEIDPEPVTVAMVQPNIPQELKWQSHYAQTTLEKLLDMSEPLWEADLLIWPEAAIPITYHRAGSFLDRLDERASEHDSALITGIIYDQNKPGARTRYYNSLIGLGQARGHYHKRRLVPFGEYVPLERWLRGAIDFFDLPTSIITRGPENQPGLRWGDELIAPSICYEVVYPDRVARGAIGSGLLLTVSNDAWFADSIGPLQHMQKARMRALETGRYLVRSTNNGVSALVDDRGRILAQSEQFVHTTLSGQVHTARGNTPFMRWGSGPLVALALLALLGVRLASRAPRAPSGDDRRLTIRSL